MTASDPAIYSRITSRITRAILVLGVLGTGVSLIRQGWRFALGFVLGACMSYLSFWRWRQVVESLGGEPKSRNVAVMVLRFVLLAGAAYGIIKYLEVNPVAVFLGLLVSAAAVIVSIFFELIYAGT